MEPAGGPALYRLDSGLEGSDRGFPTVLRMRKSTLNPEVLVTGGAGFIGSHLVDELVRRDRTVRILDNLSSGRRRNLEGLLRDGRADLVVGDVRDEALLRSVSAGCSTIYHLAASVGVGAVTRDPLASLENNLDGVGTLLRHARGLDPQPRLIYFSSSEVYGKSGVECLSEEGTFVIGPASTPRWSYAAAKIVGEYLALGSHDSYGLPVTVVRCFNTSGPRQRSTYGMVIPRFFRQALAGRPITVYGSGAQTRCFSFVGDVVESVIHLEKDPSAIGEVFNVGSDERVSVLDLAARIKDLTGSSSEIVFLPFEEAYGPGFEESEHRVPDLSKLERTTGSRPRTSLDEILGRYLDWVRGTASSSTRAVRHGGMDPESNGVHRPRRVPFEPLGPGAVGTEATPPTPPDRR